MKALTLITAFAAALFSGQPGLSGLSDEFGDPGTLPHWQVLDGDLADGIAPRYDIGQTTAGQLTIVPGRSWWFASTRAFYLYKQVSGDFKATMLVNVTGKHTALPTANWSLSGMLVRAATSDRTNENWLSFRSGVVNGTPVFERKTTRVSHSDLVLDPATPGWVELRIVRLGPRFVLLRRYPGAAWRVHWVYLRADVPHALEVGIDAFSGDEDTKADLVSHVDYFRFAATGVPPRLERRFVAGRVPVAKLLRYLSR